MEQKKKKEEDVLVVRDEKTGEISVVAGLDGKGYPKRIPPKAEHSQEFLRFDRHGDAIDNFFRNFYRQCKEPTRFGFYRVAADMVEALLPVIKDLLRDPAANAELLAPHKVDTSAYQQAEEQQATEEAKKENAETETEEQQATEEVKRENAETEAVEQQAAEEAKRENTEEDNVEQQTNEKMEEMKQENQEQQPQAAETQAVQGQEPAQDGQLQAKTQRPNLIADGDVDWKELERFGVKKENLSEKDMKALMNYGKTNLVTVNPTFGGDSYELQARLSFQKTEDGALKLTPHFVRHEPRLDIPHNVSASTMILRPICVMALSILPLFLMRFAVGMLHPNSRAMPPIPYTYFLSLSAAGWAGFVSLPCKAWRFRNMNSSPVICHTGFDKRSLISISE